MLGHPSPVRRVTLVQAALGLVVLFVLSVGAGYGVGAQVRGDEPNGSSLTAAATSTTAPASTVTPTTPGPTTAAPTTPAPSTTAATTTTAPPPTAPPTTRRTEPLRVVLAGDSVMAGLAPPVEAALEAGGEADVRFVLTPTILRDPTVRFTWSRQLEEFDPDLVVMFVGTWESGLVEGSNPGLVPGDAAWRAGYERDVLDPWMQLITSRGADVLWIANPVVRNDDANRVFANLNAAFDDLPTRWPQVHVLDAGPPLNGPDPAYHDVRTLPDGRTVRTRQTDGLHLCPEGAALLGAAVVDEVAGRYGLDVDPAWVTATGWRASPAVYPAASCPSP